MFELKISAANAEELVAQVDGLRAALLSSASGTTAPVAAKPTPRKAANDTAEENDAGAAAPSSTAASPQAFRSSAAEAAPEVRKLPEEAAAEAVKYSDVQAAVTRLAAAKGRDAVIAVFDQFGVDHGSKLTEAQWSEAVAALTDKLEG